MEPPLKRLRLGLQLRPFARPAAPRPAGPNTNTAPSLPNTNNISVKVLNNDVDDNDVGDCLDVSSPPQANSTSLATCGVGKESEEKCAATSIPRRPPFRRPMLQVTAHQAANVTGPTGPTQNDSEAEPIVKSCMWTKDVKKKKKKYEDGILVIRKAKTSLYLTEGKLMTERGVKVDPDIKSDEIIYLNNVEIEIGQDIPARDFFSGKCFSAPQQISIAEVVDKAKPRGKKISGTKIEKQKEVGQPHTDPPSLRETIPPGAFVLRPHTDTTHAVYVDSNVSKLLKPHQKDGIMFMYDCLTSKSTEGINGCIIADEMGLGKTLMTMALIHTMLKKGERGKPTLNKVLILCPASVVPGWKGEIKKWFQSKLSATTITTSVGEEFGTLLAPFKVGYQPLLIMSYEMYRNNHAKVNECKIDLVVCDEGHKLKSEGAQLKRAIAGIATLKRVLLSGTPLQNDMKEFYNLCNFVNPNVFGCKEVFRNCFLKPMSKVNNETISDTERALMLARQETFFDRVKQFLLRRTHESVNSALPPRSEFLVFIALSDIQIQLYKLLLSSKFISNAINGNGDPLTCMGMMIKLMAHPSLLHRSLAKRTADMDADDEEGKFQKKMLDLSSPKTSVLDYESSNKIHVLKGLLQQIKNKTTDKVIVVSNYTQILDCISRMCEQEKFKFRRFDGTLTIKKREEIINQINDPRSDVFVLLLSCKAGGTGTTLTGANRLILFDPDWNPAYDAQAMGRIWRHGQLKPCFIYRFFSCGSLEEKILQRQKVKLGISNKVIDSKDDTCTKFTTTDLRKVFNLNERTQCDTFPDQLDSYLSLEKSEREYYKKDSILQELVDLSPMIRFVKCNDGDPPILAEDANMEVAGDIEGEEIHEFKACQSDDDEVEDARALEL